MESLERKDASAGPEEPIKSEGIVPSPDTSERNNSAASPPPNCSICLGKLINTSFTDSCLHQFCFTCLLQWSKIKTECPLCKQTFKSIIHNVRSEEDYDQYHVQYTSQVAATLDVTADIHISEQWDAAVPVHPFMYRTTMGANRRFGMLLNPEAVARREQIPNIAPQVSSEERRRRTADPVDYRRTVYRNDLWATLPDYHGRYREFSAEYYRRHPTEVNRLIPWLNRELQVLLNNNQAHIAYVMGIITDALPQYDIRSVDFHNAVRPYFGIHTDHFVHEFSNYARTYFDLIGYDQSVTYIPNRGLSNQYVSRTVSPSPSTSSSSSSDSDVCVLVGNMDTPRVGWPSAGPHLIDMPGPSTVDQVFCIRFPFHQAPVPDVLTISSTSSSSENECEVIGYVKPRHERTPEIIDLSSSEVEETNIVPQSTSNDNTQVESLLKDEVTPSTSSSCNNDSGNRRSRRRTETEDMVTAQMYDYLYTTSDSDSKESDSDYNPTNTKSRRHKPLSKKVTKTMLRHSCKRKKTTPRKRDKEQRNRSPYSSCESDNENLQRELSSSRGTKRYLSKSSEGSDPEKTNKKKKSKKSKSKSSKKNKKHSVSKTSTHTRTLRIYSSSCSTSSSSNSDSEEASTKNKCRKRTKKANLYHYSSNEQSGNEKSSKSTRRNSLSDSRHSESSRHSPSENCEDLKDQEVTAESQRCASNDAPARSRSRSNSSDDSMTCSKRQDLAKSETTTTSSSKSDTSSPTEHSASSKTNRDRHRSRHRSHKKRKESKKRRRSHS